MHVLVQRSWRPHCQSGRSALWEQTNVQKRNTLVSRTSSKRIPHVVISTGYCTKCFKLIGLWGQHIFPLVLLNPNPIPMIYTVLWHQYRATIDSARIVLTRWKGSATDLKFTAKRPKWKYCSFSCCLVLQPDSCPLTFTYYDPINKSKPQIISMFHRWYEVLGKDLSWFITVLHINPIFLSTSHYCFILKLTGDIDFLEVKTNSSAQTDLMLGSMCPTALHSRKAEMPCLLHLSSWVAMRISSQNVHLKVNQGSDWTLLFT